MVLDKEQDKIVHSDAKNILVIASAGSGKTRVLTERIRYLVTEKSVNPMSIIAITFTNQAASEMLSRLHDVPGIGDAFIGTIHSFAYRVLRAKNKYYKILTDELDIQLHTELIKKYCKFLTVDKYSQYKQLEIQYRLKLIEPIEFKNFLDDNEKYELKKIDQEEPSGRFQETMKSVCRIRHIITFDQLLRLATKYLQELGVSTEYVFTDEFQDIGTLEYKFILQLNAKNYFFVGDDWQSIYSFKGGNVGFIKQIYNDKSYKKYYLDNNYRSCVNIIRYCSKIMDKVSDKFNKQVKCMRLESGFTCVANNDYLMKAVKFIQHSGNYKDWFILTRTNSDLYELNSLLSKSGIPCTVFKRDGASNTEIDNFMNDNTVKLMTVHASKGLENKNVLLYGRFSLSKKLYCNSKDPSYKSRLFRYEEEFKIFYVGASRAKDNLIVINTDDRNYCVPMNLDALNIKED